MNGVQFPAEAPGSVAESVDAPDLKSVGINPVGVQVPPLLLGKVVEWLMALLLKSSDVKASVGSNPTLSVSAIVYYFLSSL